MSKFSKTSYPRQLNHNNFLNSMQQRREKNLADDEIHHRQKTKLDADTQPLHHLIEKKIEIDPNLLLNGKTYTRAIKNNTHFERATKQGNRQFCSTSNDGFYKKTQERPQSKQSSRSKIAINTSLSKKKEDLVQRPQTSKGQRNIVYSREDRKKSLGDEQYEQSQQERRISQTASGNRRKTTAKQLELQTSIDPEFLSLFAS